MPDILIVDDNEPFREMLKSILISGIPAMRIREAEDGNRAVQAVETEVPELIFVDVRLPDENGFELTRKLKSAHGDVIIIMMSSYDSPEYQEAAFRSGADFFVSKQASTPEDILQRVTSIFPSG